MKQGQSELLRKITEALVLVRSSHALTETPETLLEGVSGVFMSCAVLVEVTDKVHRSLHDFGVRGTFGDGFETFKKELESVYELVHGRNRVQEIAAIQAAKKGLIFSQATFTVIETAYKTLKHLLEALRATGNTGCVVVYREPAESERSEDAGSKNDPVKIDMREAK